MSSRSIMNEEDDNDTEFGAFVSVPPATDPLSLAFETLATESSSFQESSRLPAPILPSYHDPSLSASSSSRHSTSQSNIQSSYPAAPAGSDPSSKRSSMVARRETFADTIEGDSKRRSLQFFDAFTKEAREREEKKRNEVLGELMQSERDGDPMHWLKNEKRLADTVTDGVQARLPVEGSDKTPLLDLSSLDDLAPPLSDSHSHHSHAHHRQSSHSSQAYHGSEADPRRSPTQTSPPRLAPPLASSSVAALYHSDETSDPGFFDGADLPSSLHRGTNPGVDIKTEEKRPSASRSQSYQTLSSFRSRFISSILPSTSPPINTTSASHKPPPNHQPNVSLSSQPSPFAPNHTHSGSTYATLPISGAPGFVPESESKEWDRDGRFYDDLQRRSSSIDNEVVTPTKSKNASGTGIASSSSSSLRTNSRSSSSASSHIDPSRSVDSKLGGSSKLTDASRMLMYGNSIKLTGRRESTERVLTEPLANRLRPYLPPLARLPSTWSLLYSLDQHGSSLHTLYTLSSQTSKPRTTSTSTSALGSPTSLSGTMLVITDQDENIFGVWLGGKLKVPTGPAERERYFGSGESFLWRLRPRSNAGNGGEEDSEVEVFKWTGTNEYVALCDETALSFGGGDGSYGLYIDTSFSGTSAWCPTFGNPPLPDMKAPQPSSSGLGRGSAAPGDTKGRKKVVGFDCVGVEVWGV